MIDDGLTDELKKAEKAVVQRHIFIFKVAHLTMRTLIRSLGLVPLCSAYIAFPSNDILSTEYYDSDQIILGPGTPDCESKFAACFEENSEFLSRIDCIERLKPDCTSILEKSDATGICEGTEMMLTYRSITDLIFTLTVVGKDVCYTYPIGELPFILAQGSRISVISQALNGQVYQFEALTHPQDTNFVFGITNDPVCKLGISPIEMRTFFGGISQLDLDMEMKRSAQMKKYLTIHVTKTGNFSSNGSIKLPSKGTLRICGLAKDFKIVEKTISIPAKTTRRVNKVAIISGALTGVGAATLVGGGAFWIWKRRSSVRELEAYFGEPFSNNGYNSAEDEEQREQSHAFT